MENKKNNEISWYDLNLALAENARERRRVKREWDRNLLNSRVVNTIHALVLGLGLALGTYQVYKAGIEESPSAIYENVESGRKQNYIDDLLTITPW